VNTRGREEKRERELSKAAFCAVWPSTPAVAVFDHRWMEVPLMGHYSIPKALIILVVEVVLIFLFGS
jgi:uncharacterized membrane protein (DUF485 family)